MDDKAFILWKKFRTAIEQHVLSTLQLFLRDIKRIIKNTTKVLFLIGKFKKQVQI
jgi:hypothetical protein